MIEAERIIATLKSIEDPKARAIAANDLFNVLRPLAIAVVDIRVDAVAELRFGDGPKVTTRELAEELGVAPTTLSKRIDGSGIGRRVAGRAARKPKSS